MGLVASWEPWDAGLIPERHSGLRIHCHRGGVGNNCSSDLIHGLAGALHILQGGQKRKKEKKKDWPWKLSTWALMTLARKFPSGAGTNDWRACGIRCQTHHGQELPPKHRSKNKHSNQREVPSSWVIIFSRKDLTF